MKKIIKIVIAVVIIALIAVGLYFIFRKKEPANYLYSKTYELNNSITENNVNIVSKTDEQLVIMLDFSKSHDVDQTAVASLERIVNLQTNYAVIKNEVLSNSILIANDKVKNKNDINKNFDKVKEIYKNSYKYLNSTLLQVDISETNPATIKTYIENFMNIFKDVETYYNDFYFNLCKGYVMSLESTLEFNNLYKLRLNYFSNLLNLYENAEENNGAYLTKATNYRITIKNDLVNTYYISPVMYNDIFENLNTLDVNGLVKAEINGDVSTYLEDLNDENLKTIAQNYIDHIAKI